MKKGLVCKTIIRGGNYILPDMLGKRGSNRIPSRGRPGRQDSKSSGLSTRQVTREGGREHNNLASDRKEKLWSAWAGWRSEEEGCHGS